MIRPYDPYDDMPELIGMDMLSPEEQDEFARHALLYGCGMYFVVFIIAIICALLLSCTTTKYVPVVEHKTDTMMMYSNTRDSIYLHDSTYIREAGDTVSIERWHTRYRDRWQHDTLYLSKTDSIPKPYPVEVVKEVAAELTWWERMRLSLGTYTLYFVGIGLGVWFLKRKLL